MKINNWHNCYDDGWQGLIVPEKELSLAIQGTKAKIPL